MRRMSSPAIPQSPTARLLLDLATTRASCEVAVGERVLIVVDGALLDVRGSDNDCSLPEFLQAAGRIEERERQSVEARMRAGLTLDQALAELRELEPEALLETRRALLLDRMVRAFGPLEAHDASPTPTPLRHAERGQAFDLVSLVLDTLARRAAFGAAEIVGEMRRARFMWVETPAQKRAASWAELGDIPHAMSVSTLFPRHPAAPSRIAALVRASVARLDVGGATAVPAAPDAHEPAKPGAAAAGDQRTEDASVPPSAQSPTARPEADPPPAAPTNGTAKTHGTHGTRGPLEIVPTESWLPRAHASLGDPLVPLEAKLDALNASSAPAAERAAAWLALANAWREYQQASTEATRAAREAAAADPSDPRALATAAALTSASGSPQMAYAYARAWAHALTEPSERARALAIAADYARRAERPFDQREALLAAVEAAPKDADFHEQLAHVLADNQELQLAAEHARRAAELVRNEQPERARVLLGWASVLLPNNLRCWNDLAKLLTRAGKSPLAVATLAQAARQQTDSAIRERLRLSAIAFAELAMQRESAIELLLEAVDSGSALSEPLLTHLHAAGAWLELAIVAEQIALHEKGSARAALLAEAAEARRQLPDGAAQAIELLTEALCLDPESAPIYEALAELTQLHEKPQALLDALERAARVWDVAANAHEVSAPDDPSTSADESDRQRKLALLITRMRALPSEATTAALVQFAAESSARLDGVALDAETALTLHDHRARFEQVAQELEQALRAADTQQRTEPALRLAALCRQEPARRSKARRLYEKILLREPAQREAFHGLESVLRLEGDEAGLDALAELRCQSEPGPRAQLALAYRHRRAGRIDEALAACERALGHTSEDAAADGPTKREALVLSWRLSAGPGQHKKHAAALEALALATEAPAARAAAWMRLARAQRLAGERAAAVATSELALATDPQCADAALALQADLAEHALEPKIELLRALRAVLGDLPELLRQLARAAFAAADPQGQREALETLARLLPSDGFAARSLVALRSTGRDPQALRLAIERALEPACFGKQTPQVVQQGLSRLAALSGLDLSVAIVLTSIERLGEQARPLLHWAGSVAHELKSHALHIALLEQQVAHGDVDARREVLGKLAALRREQGMLWAAARTELRLLALAPNDTAALERLASLYAETGELERLDAVLGLLYERASSDVERRTRLFDRAACLLRFGDDGEPAAKLIEQAFQPDERDGRDAPVSALRQGIGLLLDAAPERAFSVLLSLAQRASQERSSDLIEEAMLLAEQQLARPDLALVAASQGALRKPQHERFVETLERLGRSAGQQELLVTTLEEAAERCDDLARQAELLLRAAAIAEHELDDAVRASVLLDRAYRATPTDPIEELVLANAGRLFARDVRAGKLAYDRLRDTLHVRAKFGPWLGRAHALMTLARLAHEIYLNGEEALSYIEAARAALAHDVPESEREPIHRQLDALATRLTQASSAVRALTRTPDKAPKNIASELEAPFAGLLNNAQTFRPLAGSIAPPVTMIPIGRMIAPGQTNPPLITIVPRGDRARPEPELSVGAVVATRTREVADDAESVVRAICRGDTAALKPLGELLQREPERAAVLCADLLQRARSSHFNVCLLRGLRLASGPAHEHALWRTSSQALAFIEPPLRPPPSGRRRDTRSAEWEIGLIAARATDWSAALALCGQLVEAAAPLFRKSLASVPGLAKEPELLREAPYAPLLNDLTQTFGARHDAYLAHTGDDRVSVVSAQPAHFIIGNRTPPDAASLRFRLARAFEYARAENVLLATLSPVEAEHLLSAVCAAFADNTPAHVSREAAALAADLWRTMPSKAQRTLAAELKTLPMPLPQAELAAAVRLRGARVALCATRELDVALTQLGADGDATDARLERSEGAFNRALLEKPLVHGLMSYAFSDAYLHAVVEDG